METRFWTAIVIYHTSLIGAITVQPVMISITAALFFTIPGLTEVELIPGIRDSVQAQLETLKTQIHLNRERYYENVQ